MSRPRPVCNHHLLPDLLARDSVVLDLGAYRGDFARGVRQLCGGRVIAVEANPDFIPGLEGIPGIEAVHAAVGAIDGEAELYLAGNELGSSLLAAHSEVGERQVTVPATTLPRLIEERCGGRLDLLKLNVEGVEIEIFDSCDDATLRAIGQITVQFHDFLPELDLEVPVKRAKRRLRRLGFGEILFKAPNKDVLFVNLASGLVSRRRFHLERLRVRLLQYLGTAIKKLRLARLRRAAR